MLAGEGSQGTVEYVGLILLVSLLMVGRLHEGRKPTEEEAAKALGSALQLQRDFVERLRAQGLGDKLPQVPAEVKHAADAGREQAGEWDY